MIPRRIARLNEDGSTDLVLEPMEGGFNPGDGLDAAANAVTVLPDGRVIAGGAFMHADGEGRSRVAVFQTDGRVDEATADADGVVHFFLTQQDGRVVVGGAFSEIGGQLHSRLARLGEGLVAEAAFEPVLDAPCLAGALQRDGKILLAGSFTKVETTPVQQVARLYNTAAGSSLRLEFEGMVAESPRFSLLWTLDGACPAGLRVMMEGRSHSGGAEGEWSSWSLLGAPGQKPELVDGSWVMSGLGVGAGAAHGELRARLVAGDGRSQGLVEQVVAYTVSRSLELYMLEPDAEGGDLEVPLEDENSSAPLELGETQVGITKSMTVYLRNPGLEPLVFSDLSGTGGGLYAELAGSGLSQWQAVLEGLSTGGVLAPLATARLMLLFSPTEVGRKNVMVRLVSDDPAEAEQKLHVSAMARPGPGTRDGLWQQTVTRDAARQKKNQTVQAGALAAYHSRVATVQGSALQTLTDSLLLFGGDFELVRGTARNRFAQISLDTVGTLLTQNGSQGANNMVHCAAILPGGNVMLGGAFTAVNGKTTAKYLARLNRDGSVDGTYRMKPVLANGLVARAMAVQADGLLLLALDCPVKVGKITTQQGLLKRVSANSTNQLQKDKVVNGAIHSVAVQKDGKILIGGAFTLVDGQARSGLARLQPDLTLDAAFKPCLNPGSVVQAVALHPAVGGEDSVVVAVRGQGVHMLSGVDGKNDLEWTVIDKEATSLGVQADGRLLVAGPDLVARFMADGSPDGEFVASVVARTGSDSATAPYGLTIHADGSVLVCGGHDVRDILDEATGITNGRVYPLMRLMNDRVPEDNSLQILDSRSIKWVRTGSAPDVAVVTLELSENNGTTWRLLTTAQHQARRVPDGWYWGGTAEDGSESPALPARGLVRARGRVRGGHGNGCDGLVEEVRAYPAPNDRNIEVPDLGVTWLPRSAAPVQVQHGGAPLLLPSGADGSEQTFLLNLTNTGSAPLRDLAFSSSSTALLDVQSVPQSELLPGQSMQVTVAYRSHIGLINGGLVIRSNVPGAKGAFSAAFIWSGYKLPVISSATATVSSLTTSAVQLVASVVANDAAARLRFEVWPQGNPAAVIHAPGGAGYDVSGFATQRIAGQISGLLPSTTYEFRAVLQNSGHTVNTLQPYPKFRTKDPV